MNRDKDCGKCSSNSEWRGGEGGPLVDTREHKPDTVTVSITLQNEAEKWIQSQAHLLTKQTGSQG